MREKDMARIILGSGAVGFMATDTFGELLPEIRSNLVYSQICSTGLSYVVATPRFRDIDPGEVLLTIATSYPRATECIMKLLRWPYETVLELGGSVEAAPYLDPTIDAIVDIRETGKTLRDNELDVISDGILGVDFGMVWRSSS